jgi:hypothetical protein
MARGRNMGTRTATSGRCGHSANVPATSARLLKPIAFLLHNTRPRLGALLEEPGADDGPGPLRDSAFQDAIFAACDRMVGIC